jgi:hypothetical protein
LAPFSLASSTFAAVSAWGLVTYLFLQKLNRRRLGDWPKSSCALKRISEDISVNMYKSLGEEFIILGTMDINSFNTTTRLQQSESGKLQ